LLGLIRIESAMGKGPLSGSLFGSSTAVVTDVQHGVFMQATWQSPLLAAATRAHERLGPRVQLLPAQRRIGNWLGIADVLCHPNDYESHCFSINEAWLAGVPVVSCDYLVNRQFEERLRVSLTSTETRVAASVLIRGWFIWPDSLL
jgi:hypothetical protein